MSASFVHLHLHTEYSLVDGIVRIKPLMEAVAAAGMPAVALTDQSNLFAMVKFYRAAQAAGIKPIIGVDVWLCEDDDPDAEPSRLVLLCRNETGYRNLTRLVSRSYTEGQQRGVARLQRGWLRGNTAGLIALSGGLGGDVAQALLRGRGDEAKRRLLQWRELFADDFYLEVTRTGRPGEEDYLHAAVELAAATATPVVASNDVRFLTPADFEAHEARVCINEGRTLDDPRRPRRYSEQQYLRSPEEMAELFADLPEALENSVEIAKRCTLEIKLGDNYLPEFPVPEGLTMAEFFRQQARAGLEKRLDFLFDRNAPDFAERRKPYDERLETELNVIIDMGFPGYFLIVADFIQWAKEQGIPVGPGRGSGAGSLVAYALTITDLDPLQYDLLFERFLNPERVSMPDFDIDFCMENRDRVIDYVARRYGREKVSQIITYGTMAAKAVVRDVGRVLGHPYGFVDKIAKLIPFELGITLDKALEEEPQLRERYENEEEVQTLIDLARSLEGITRNAGKHAGGVVIAPTELTDFTPLYCEEGGASLVTQFDKDDVEAVGLVKFDFLGLRTLTIIDWAIKNVAAQTGEHIDITRIPLDDPKTFELLKACQTTAVFQLESRGMKDLIKRLQPDTFEDIVALVALFRPGPLGSGMVDDFINRKHGRAKVEYPHPDLEPVLKPTYGVILYQEQVMQIAQVLANYTLGGADMLRRAMGKKKPEEMAKQREIFNRGAAERGIDAKLANHIFDLMETFAGYGFNKSHSAAYALVSYQTAWLKAYYPAAFMAAVMSADMDNTDKVVNLIDECQQLKLKVLPPDINVSAYPFTVADQATVRYGLGAIKGVGESAIQVIVAERERGGPFSDLFDFCRRIDLRRVNRRCLETLIKAGALDGFGSRARLMASLDQALQAAEQYSRDSSAGQNDLFGFAAAATAGGNEQATSLVAAPEWTDKQRLDAEKESLGLYLSGHPIDQYLPELARMNVTRIKALRPRKNATTLVAGLVTAIRTMKTKRGDTMAFLSLDDQSGRLEVAVFADLFAQHRERLIKDSVLVVAGEVAVDDYSGGIKMVVREIHDMDQAREQHAKGLVLRPGQARCRNGLARELADALAPYRDGRCPVRLWYERGELRGRLDFGDTWRVHPSDECLARLRNLLGAQAVEVEY